LFTVTSKFFFRNNFYYINIIINFIQNITDHHQFKINCAARNCSVRNLVTVSPLLISNESYKTRCFTYVFNICHLYIFMHCTCLYFCCWILYPRSPNCEGGILFYLCPSVRPSFRPSKIFLVAFFSLTVDSRNLIFGHKRHIGIPYCG
jgi:hypothetical protein